MLWIRALRYNLYLFNLGKCIRTQSIIIQTTISLDETEMFFFIIRLLLITFRSKYFALYITKALPTFSSKVLNWRIYDFFSAKTFYSEDMSLSLSLRNPKLDGSSFMHSLNRFYPNWSALNRSDKTNGEKWYNADQLNKNGSINS